MSGWLHELRVADLDGDGTREWVGGSGPAVKLFDEEGSLYWEHALNGGAHLVGIRDVNGDGFQEIIAQDSVRVTALQANGSPLWASPPFHELAAAIMGPSGDIFVQGGDRLYELNANGEPTRSEDSAIAEGRLLAARLATPRGEVNLFTGMRERFFGGPADRFPLVDGDIDGDDRNDVVVVARNGVVAYDTAGAALLRVRGHDVIIGAAAAGNLDGQPGDEVVLFIGQYGLVVLGRAPSTKIAAEASWMSSHLGAELAPARRSL